MALMDQVALDAQPVLVLAFAGMHHCWNHPRCQFHSRHNRFQAADEQLWILIEVKGGIKNFNQILGLIYLGSGLMKIAKINQKKPWFTFDPDDGQTCWGPLSVLKVHCYFAGSVHPLQPKATKVYWEGPSTLVKLDIKWNEAKRSKPAKPSILCQHPFFLEFDMMAERISIVLIGLKLIQRMKLAWDQIYN